MGGRITALQEQIRGFRTALNEKATQLVQNFKENGVMALNHVCDFLGVKDTMVQLKISMLSSAADMQKSMDKIDQVSQELREVSTHAKNVGRAVVGKEALAVPEPKESGFFHQMKRPYRSMKEFCTNQAEKLEKTIEGMERMEQSAERTAERRAKMRQEKQKPSIMEKLQGLKGQQQSQAKAAAVDKSKKQENVR